MRNDVTKARVQRIIKSGSAHLVNLPMGFIRKTGLGKGDDVVVAYDDSVLMVMPSPSKFKELNNGNREQSRQGHSF